MVLLVSLTLPSKIYEDQTSRPFLKIDQAELQIQNINWFWTHVDETAFISQHTGQ